jgi:hypothetical protein
VEDAVYQAVLLDLVDDAPMTELHVSRISAAHPYHPEELLQRPELAGLMSETVDNFRTRIVATRRVSSSLSCPKPVFMVQPEDLNDFCFVPGACNGKPGRLRAALEFSTIGFNPGHTQALVYATFGTEGGCAGSYYYLLRRIEERWDVMKVVQVLIT